MEFSKWWEKHNPAYGNQVFDILAKSHAKEAWKASRENLENQCVTKSMPFTINVGNGETMTINQKEYPKHEFCRDGECEHIYNQKHCVVDDIHCAFTAKEFHHWLKENGYRIVKD